MNPLDHDPRLTVGVCLAVGAAAQGYRLGLGCPPGRQGGPRGAISALPLALGLGGAVLAVGAGDPELLGLVPLFLLLIVPWSVMRRLLVPLGQVRASYLVAQLADAGLGNDTTGGPALAAALALLHRRDATDDEVRWVEQQIDEAKPLRAGGVAAAAVLALRRGDEEGARQLFQSVESLAGAGAPAMAVRLSREWLAADAAARGDWAAVAAVADAPQAWLSSRSTHFLGAAARRLLGRPDAPGDERLWALWAVGPARRQTRALLQRALAAPRGSSIEPSAVTPAPAPPVPAEPLQAALTLQVRMWSSHRGASLDEATRLGEAWDAALRDPALERRLLVRSLELGATEGMRLRERLGAVAASELAGYARERGLPLGEGAAAGSTLGRAARELRDALLIEMETASEALRRRAIDRRELPPVDEWREWLSLRRRYEQLGRLSGQGARRLGWPKVRDDVCKQAVWLWNVRGEKTIANAMFRWLLAEAIDLGDTEATELQQKNVDCGT